MYQFGEGLQYKLLDLLADGPSSFAALYGALVRHCGYPCGLGVTLVSDALLQMERRQWVTAKQMANDGSFHIPTTEERNQNLPAYRAWLPNAAFEELSVDEVGLWYELTAEGRAEWKQCIDAEEQAQFGRWTLDDLSDTNTIIIQAETLEVAEVILQWWLVHNSIVELLNNSRSIEPVSTFTLSDGTVVSTGIKLSCRYQTPESPSR